MAKESVPKTTLIEPSLFFNFFVFLNVVVIDSSMHSVCNKPFDETQAVVFLESVTEPAAPEPRQMERHYYKPTTDCEDLDGLICRSEMIQK